VVVDEDMKQTVVPQVEILPLNGQSGVQEGGAKNTVIPKTFVRCDGQEHRMQESLKGLECIESQESPNLDVKKAISPCVGFWGPNKESKKHTVMYGRRDIQKDVWTE
jgi:hypothetical protein